MADKKEVKNEVEEEYKSCRDVRWEERQKKGKKK